jgi:hypothetical protein
MSETDPAARDPVAGVDYWLSKLFFDLSQDPAKAARWRADRGAILDEYPVSRAVRAAILEDDLAVLAPRVNAYLLRFYFTVCGMNDAEFIRRLNTIKPPGGTARG